jgi:hypothetical protein
MAIDVVHLRWLVDQGSLQCVQNRYGSFGHISLSLGRPMNTIPLAHLLHICPYIHIFIKTCS